MTARPVVYNADLKAEYTNLFNTCRVRPERTMMADSIVNRICLSKDRYSAIAEQIGCPWYIVGLIHSLECGLDFKKHLHNGDPLTARTTHVPSGRPVTGDPPFTFDASAIDALRLLKFNQWKDWSVAGVLWKLECYNGLGYRQYHPQVKSPYLWSFTNHYIKGKYVADGRFDANAVSQQLGIAAILKRGFDLRFFP